MNSDWIRQLNNNLDNQNQQTEIPNLAVCAAITLSRLVVITQSKLALVSLESCVIAVQPVPGV